MSVLFVCRANIGRSQAAAALYEKLELGKAESAGTVVDNPGQKLSEQYVAYNILSVMLEHGIDMSNNERRPVSPDILDEHDKVIIMSEPEVTPTWLADHPNSQTWTIDDPFNKSIDDTRMIVNSIQAHIVQLLKL